MSLDSLFTAPRPVKQAISFGFDLICLFGAFWIALALQNTLVELDGNDTFQAFLWMVLSFIGVSRVFGLYSNVSRYTDTSSILRMIAAAGTFTLTNVLLFDAIVDAPVQPSTLIVHGLMMTSALICSRLFVRQWFIFSRGNYHLRHLRRRVLIVGMQDAGVEVANTLRGSHEYQLIGFVDSDPQFIGRYVQNLRVFDLRDLAKVVQEFSVSDIIISWSEMKLAQRKSILSQCEGLQVHVRNARMEIGMQAPALRELNMEDLLGRDRVPPDIELLRLKNHGKVVLVSGAGGSIGSELCRQLITTRPAGLVLLDNSEFNLYRIHRELRELVDLQFHQVKLTPVLGDVRDAKRVREVLSHTRPAVFYHAAAYKHVPMVERNPFEGLRNNFLGTRKCAMLAAEHGVRDFVLISSDKAVRPTNIMGASKRMAELSLQALAADPAYSSKTTFSAVRFGNVLGSSGSVIDKFREQISKLGPVTVTHPDATRYFMTIPEAAELVIQAAAVAHGGEVFVLDMGQPVKIMELAKRMIRLSGYTVKSDSTPDGQIAIEVMGLRPGEKLYEELLISGELNSTPHVRIKRIKEQFLPLQQLDRVVEKLELILASNNVTELKSLLSETVEGYVPESVDYNSLTWVNQRPIWDEEINAVDGEMGDINVAVPESTHLPIQ